jgi:hypothetical protein
MDIVPVGGVRDHSSFMCDVTSIARTQLNIGVFFTDEHPPLDCTYIFTHFQVTRAATRSYQGSNQRSDKCVHSFAGSKAPMKTLCKVMEDID